MCYYGAVSCSLFDMSQTTKWSHNRKSPGITKDDVQEVQCVVDEEYCETRMLVKMNITPTPSTLSSLDGT